MRRSVVLASVLTGIVIPSVLAEPGLVPTTQLPERPASADHALGMSLFWENDGNFAKPNGATDRDYTAGDAIAVQWQTPWMNNLAGSLPSINQEFAKDTPGVSFAGGMELSLNIYTPDDLTDPNPIYNDHPYAGWTYVGLIVQRANRAADVPVFEHIELDPGTIGPTGQAGKIQKFVHNSFNFIEPEGWDNQIREEFGVDFKYQRRWRFDLANSLDSASPTVQLIPEAGFIAGTIHDDASAGATLRMGWNMPDDFGPNRMRYASDFTRPFGNGAGNGSFFRSLGGYAFIRPTGRVVGHDSTLEGSFFRSSPVEQDAQTFVGELQVGVAIQFLRHWEVGYSQTYFTQEYADQKANHSIGALTLTYVQTW